MRNRAVALAATLYRGLAVRDSGRLPVLCLSLVKLKKPPISEASSGGWEFEISPTCHKYHRT